MSGQIQIDPPRARSWQRRCCHRPTRPLFPSDRATVFFERHDVGHDLAGMCGWSVRLLRGHPHIRHFKQCFFKGADHDHVHIAAQHTGRVMIASPCPNCISAPERTKVCPPDAHPHQNRPASVSKVFQNQRDHVTCQRLFGVHRALS